MNIDRLLEILTFLLQNDRVSAPYLAAKLGVNRRTIIRDIEILCQAGIPVFTYRGVGGGIAIAKDFKFDYSVLTTGELGGIIAALKGVGSSPERSRMVQTPDKMRG